MKYLLFTVGILTFLLSCKNEKEPKGFDYYEAIDNCDGLPFINTNVIGNNGISYSMMKPNCIIGAQLPELNLISINDQKLDKSFFSKKPTIVNFWFQSCKPCLLEIPTFNKMVNKYGDKVNFVGVSPDAKGGMIKFLHTNPYNVTQVSDAKNLIMGTLKNRWGFPLTLVVDQNMTIVDGIMGAQEESVAPNTIEAFLEEAINTSLKN